MRVGILGYGSIGKRHAANALALGHDVKSYDPLLSRAENRNEVIEWADKIVIASPTNQHIQDIIDCNTHKKPMLVEKPIAHVMSEVLNSKYIEMVGYNLRFHALVIAMHRAILDGKIGKPLWARFVVGQVPKKEAYLRDGVTLNWSHEIDLALHLLGPATFKAANVNQEDSISDILLTHESGCLTSLHLNYVCDPWVRVGGILGDMGEIACDLEAGWASVRALVPRDEFDASYVKELTAFLNDREGGASAQDALHVLSICLKARDTR